jgi:hypothetical protein
VLPLFEICGCVSVHSWNINVCALNEAKSRLTHIEVCLQLVAWKGTTQDSPLKAKWVKHDMNNCLFSRCKCGDVASTSKIKIRFINLMENEALWCERDGGVTEEKSFQYCTSIDQLLKTLLIIVVCSWLQLVYCTRSGKWNFMNSGELHMMMSKVVQ